MFVFTFLPYLSLTIGCRNTVVNGSLPVSCSPIMTIRATQKNRISIPVSSSLCCVMKCLKMRQTCKYSSKVSDNSKRGSSRKRKKHLKV
jgi:hypothetical protein